MDLNLALFRLDSESKILERNGGFHYGELVNKFIRGKPRFPPCQLVLKYVIYS